MSAASVCVGPPWVSECLYISYIQKANVLKTTNEMFIESADTKLRDDTTSAFIMDDLAKLDNNNIIVIIMQNECHLYFFTTIYNVHL